MSSANVVADHAIAWAGDSTHLVIVWEVSAATRVRALRGLGPEGHDARDALRVVAEHGATLIDLPAGATVRTIEATPGGRYVIEVGLRAGAAFIPFVRSGQVETPPAEPTGDMRVTWVSAAAPRTAVATAWSGRRLPFTSVDLGGSRSSDGV